MTLGGICSLSRLCCEELLTTCLQYGEKQLVSDFLSAATHYQQQTSHEEVISAEDKVTPVILASIGKFARRSVERVVTEAAFAGCHASVLRVVPHQIGRAHV